MPTSHPDQQEPLEQQFENLTSDERRGRLLILPDYELKRDEFVQPDHIVAQFRYFWDEWVPVLGPVPSIVYMKLRQYTYYNRRTGELREELSRAFPKQEEIAQSLGIERKALMRHLKTLEKHGLLVRKGQTRFSRQHARQVRTTDRYYLKIIDILTPEHQTEILIEDTLGRPLESLNKPANAELSQKGTYQDSSVDKLVEMSQNGTFPSSPKTGQPSSVPKEYLNNVVQRLQKASKDQRSETAKIFPNPQREELASYIEDKLATIDPNSTPYQNHRYYLLLADRLPRDLIDQALTVVRDYRDDRKIRKSARQAFHGTITRMAKQAGIELPTKKPNNSN